MSEYGYVDVGKLADFANNSTVGLTANDIMRFPRADVKPVRHGHWYDNTYRYVDELDAYFIQACCSCCNRYSDKLDQYTKIMSNETCSHCGADMREPEAIKG